MDRYTLMASKCKQLQDEWEPKVWDRVWYREKRAEQTIIKYSEAEIKFWIIDTNGVAENIVSAGAEWYKKYFKYLPSLEDLIEMLEDCNWELACTPNEVDIGYWATNTITGKEFHGETPQEALLKLVAYERWGLTWDKEKEDWV